MKMSFFQVLKKIQTVLLLPIPGKETHEQGAGSEKLFLSDYSGGKPGVFLI
jgi:hypothetical protein